jgi:hypothetical protein
VPRALELADARRRGAWARDFPDDLACELASGNPRDVRLGHDAAAAAGFVHDRHSADLVLFHRTAAERSAASHGW